MPKKAKCENCGHDLEIVEGKPQQITIPPPEAPPSQVPPQQSSQLLQQYAPPPPPQPQKEPERDKKKLSHEEIAEMMPKGINAMECPGGDCGHMKLKNPKQTKKFKTCPHCEANTVPKGNEFCPTCTKNIDPDDLEDGVSLESDEDEE